MTIAGTSNKNLFSRLITWALKEKSSHLIFHFKNGISVHSNPMGLHPIWTKTFHKFNKCHWSIEIELTPFQEEVILKEIMDKHDDDAYDWPAFFYMSLRLLLKVLFNIPVPHKNKWAQKNLSLCVALPAKSPKWFLGTLKESEIEMKSPDQLKNTIIAELKSKGFNILVL